MGFSNGFILALAVLIITGFLLLTVGTATHSWMESEISGSTVTIGLFKTCYMDICQSFDIDTWYHEYAHTMRAIRAFCILGVISSGIAFVLLFLIMLKINKRIQCLPDTKRLGIVYAVLCFCAGVFTLLGLIVFIAKWYKAYNSIDPSFSFKKGASFYCCVAGVVILVVDGFIALIFVKKFTPESPPSASTQGQVSYLPPTVYQIQAQTQQQQYFQNQQGQIQGQQAQQGGEPSWQRHERGSPWLHGQMNQYNHMQQPLAVRLPSHISSTPSFQPSQPANMSAPPFGFDAATSPLPPTSPLPLSYECPPPSYESVTKQPDKFQNQ